MTDPLQITEYQCNLCGNKRFKYRDPLTRRLGCDPHKHKVVKCSKCTLHSLFPIPTDSELDLIYANYADQGNRIAVETFRMENVYPNKIALIKKYVSNGTRILDIGAGIGGFAAIAKREGFHVVGVEFQREQCVLAKQLFNADLICNTFEEFLKQNTTMYDAIHLHHVLEHLRDPKGALLNAGRILKPNGIIVLEVPNQFFVLKHELYQILGKVNSKKPYNPYHHLYFFSPITLEKMLRIGGYDVVELNEMRQDITRTFRNRMNCFLSYALRMGVSSRIEAVARWDGYIK